MANPEHVEIVKQGRAAIAEWRGPYRRNSILDLSGVDLIGADLSHADLSSSNLIRTNLSRATLRSANLIGSDLSDADLSNADLSHAILSSATLRGANLVGADLSCADLSDANLINAKLTHATITRATLIRADFNAADLSIANMSGATLIGGFLANADLSLANLIGANLRNSDLSEGNFSDADLTMANLAGANLRGADLRKASFRGAELGSANLSSADLTGADLRGATLSDSILTETNFRHVRFDRTVFSNLDFSTCKGLDHAQFSGPCTIGVDTLYLSGGKIPESFLGGCGVAKDLIVYLPSLLGAQEPIEFYSCFISYSHVDEEFCKRLHSRMRDERLRVWLASEDMKAGRKLHEQIDDAIRVHDKLLLVLSEKSMASEWVNTEIYKARQREVKEKRQVLFPIRLVPFERLHDWSAFDSDTGRDMAREIREYFIPDFSSWRDHDSFEAGFKKLLEALKQDA